MEETAYDARLDPDEPRAVLDCGCVLEWNNDDGSAELTFCISHRYENASLARMPVEKLVEVADSALADSEIEQTAEVLAIICDKLTAAKAGIAILKAAQKAKNAAENESFESTELRIDTLRSMLKAA